MPVKPSRPEDPEFLVRPTDMPKVEPAASRDSPTAARARVALRPATPADSNRLLAWRNSEAVRAVSRTSAMIARADHERWFARILEGEDSLLWIATLVGEGPVGMLRLDRDPTSGSTAVVSIVVDQQFRQRGLGRLILQQGIIVAHEAWRELATLRAEVKFGNESSLALFRSAGFVEAFVSLELPTPPPR